MFVSWLISRGCKYLVLLGVLQFKRMALLRLVNQSDFFVSINLVVSCLVS